MNDDAPADDGTQKEVPKEPTVIRIQLCLQERDVEIIGLSGEVEKAVLREMPGAERDAWLNSMSPRLKGTAGVKEFKNLQASLISRCLFSLNGKAISEGIISRWPSTAQKQRFTICQEMNALTDEAVDKEKKD